MYPPTCSRPSLINTRTLSPSAPSLFSITERPRDVAPILIDLDFRADTDTGAAHKLYQPAAVLKFVKRLFLVLTEFVDLAHGAECYVLEKPARLSKGAVKDGIHIVVPSVVARPHTQRLVRERLLSATASIFSACIGSGRTVQDVYDLGVCELKNNWFLYGSKKPDEATPWIVSRVFSWHVGK